MRAARRQRMRGAAAFIVGKCSATHMAPGRAVSGGHERHASRRWRSSLRAYLREKQLSRDKLFAVAQQRDRRTRAKAVATFQAGTREAVRRRALGYALGDALRAAPNPKAARTPIDSLCKQTRWITLLPSVAKWTNVTFGRRPAKPGTTHARPRESRVVAGRAAAPCPDHDRWNRPVLPLYRARASRATGDAAR